MKATANCLRNLFVPAFCIQILIWCGSLRVLAEDGPPIITVEATGKVEATPDLAIVTLLVKEQQDSVKDARTKNEDKMAKVRAALTQTGVKEEEISVLPPSVHVFSPGPMGFAFPNAGTPKIQQVVSSTLVIEIPHPQLPNLENVWKIIEAAIDAGAEVWSSDNASYVPQFQERSAISLTVKDHEPLKLAAMKDATSKAKAQAEATAEGLGMKLGEIANAKVECGHSEGGEIFQTAMESFGAGKSSSDSIKKITITQSVTVAYRLAK